MPRKAKPSLGEARAFEYVDRKRSGAWAELKAIEAVTPETGQPPVMCIGAECTFYIDLTKRAGYRDNPDLKAGKCRLLNVELDPLKDHCDVSEGPSN